MTLQVYLNTLRPQISFERAAKLLRGPEAAFVAVDDFAKLQAVRRADDPPIHTLVPASGVADTVVTRIISNRPTFNTNEPVAFCFGNFFVRAREARLLELTGREMRFTCLGGKTEVLVANESDQPRKACVFLERNGETIRRERLVQANTTWAISPD
jgi:hypothetical protein